MKSAATIINRSFRHALMSSFVLLVFSMPLGANQMWKDLFNEHLENAKAGQADAQYELGIMYLKGQGCEQDRNKAMYWLKAAADSGYQLASSKLSRIEEQEAKFRELQDSASAGKVDAQYELAMMYLKGRGVEADGAKARDWLQKAADSNDSKAITRLGIVNYKGEGGKVDYKRALTLFNRVADKSVLAQYYLGEMYAGGAGTNRDYVTAISWYKKAADGGFNRARGKIINLEEEMRMEKRRAANLASDRKQAQAEEVVKPKVEKKVVARAEPAAPVPAPAPAVGKPAVKKVVAKPEPNPLDVLAGMHWVRGDRPVDYLPSKVTQCDMEDGELVCFSEVLTRVTGTQTVQYRVKSFVKSKNDAIVITYRNLVLDVTDSQEPEDQPLGYDDQAEQGFHIQTGWTPEHNVSCRQPSRKGMACVKDDTHKMTLVAAN